MNTSDLLSVVVQFGLFGMFAAAVFEKTIPIIPSYLMLLIFGSATTTADELVAAIAATSTGSLIGTAGVYTLGRFLGEERVKRVVDKYGTYIFLPSKRYRRLANAHRRNHFTVSLFGQMIPVARLYLSVPAGVLRLRPGRFLLASAIGIAAYNTVFLTTGFTLRGATHDPVAIGILVSLAMVTAELSIAGGIHFLLQKRCSAGV